MSYDQLPLQEASYSLLLVQDMVVDLAAASGQGRPANSRSVVGSAYGYDILYRAILFRPPIYVNDTEFPIYAAGSRTICKNPLAATRSIVSSDQKEVKVKHSRGGAEVGGGFPARSADAAVCSPISTCSRLSHILPCRVRTGLLALPASARKYAWSGDQQLARKNTGASRPLRSCSTKGTTLEMVDTGDEACLDENWAGYAASAENDEGRTTSCHRRSYVRKFCDN